MGSGADRPRADSAPGAVGRNAPCASQHGKRVKVVGIRARANCVSVRRREAPGVAAWVPHTHGASLCRRRAAPVAHRPTWLLASSPVEAPVPGVLELWFEERVPGSDPGLDGHRGGCPRGRSNLLGAYGAPRGAIVRVRRRNIANAETGSCVSGSCGGQSSRSWACSSGIVGKLLAQFHTRAPFTTPSQRPLRPPRFAGSTRRFPPPFPS